MSGKALMINSFCTQWITTNNGQRRKKHNHISVVVGVTTRGGPYTTLDASAVRLWLKSIQKLLDLYIYYLYDNVILYYEPR